MKEIRVTVEKIGTHGYGIGYAENKTVFIPYTIPGDDVIAFVRHENTKICFADIKEYKTYSKDYKKPDCTAFGHVKRCGGCDWLNVDYATQLVWKDKLISEIMIPVLEFAQQKNEPVIKTIIPSPQPWHYRNKSFLPVGTKNRTIVYGMFERLSHQIVTHTNCLLQCEVFDTICSEIMEFCKKAGILPYNEQTEKGCLRHIGLRTSTTTNEIILILVTKSRKLPFSNLFVKHFTSQFPNIVGIIQNIQRSNTNIILGDEDKLLWGTDSFNVTINSLNYKAHYRSFLQVNHSISEIMYNSVLQHISPHQTVIDAYCGIGTIGLLIAKHVKQVIGIEVEKDAIMNANYNAQQNSIENATFFYGKVEDLIPNIMLSNKVDTIILDPPRKGVEQVVLKSISASNIEQIIYISCNPMTLARDMRILISEGYIVNSIQPFDMFPQTWHIETMAVLKKK